MFSAREERVCGRAPNPRVKGQLHHTLLPTLSLTYTITENDLTIAALQPEWRRWATDAGHLLGLRDHLRFFYQP